MSSHAPTVHTDPDQIAALEALLPQLRGQTQVELTLDDGSHVRGTVVVQPTVQQYLDAEQNEGSNGQLRLEDLDDTEQQHRVWLDRIAAVRVLPHRE
jgi:hypothetical protein